MTQYLQLNVILFITSNYKKVPEYQNAWFSNEVKRHRSCMTITVSLHRIHVEEWLRCTKKLHRFMHAYMNDAFLRFADYGKSA